MHQAHEFVAGFCVANDVSGRKSQFDDFNGGQWVNSEKSERCIILYTKSARMLTVENFARPAARALTHSCRSALSWSLQIKCLVEILKSQCAALFYILLRLER